MCFESVKSFSKTDKLVDPLLLSHLILDEIGYSRESSYRSCVQMLCAKRDKMAEHEVCEDG